MTRLNKMAVVSLPKGHTHAIVHESERGQKLLVTSGDKHNLMLMMNKLHFVGGKTEIVEVSELRNEYNK